jgi:lysine 2,3-aminomutase
LQLKLDEAIETKAIGIEKLLADFDDQISLTPHENARHKRREKKK